MLLCCSAAHRRTWYGYGRIRETLKLRRASDSLQTCILKMLAKDPDSRYSMHQALHDPWLLEACKPDSFPTSSHSHPPPTSPAHMPSHAPSMAMTASNARKRAMNKPAVKSVKTRAGTQASTKPAAKADPAPLVQHASKFVKRKAQMPIHTDCPLASLTKGVHCIYGIFMNQVVKLHDCATTILH